MGDIDTTKFDKVDVQAISVQGAGITASQKVATVVANLTEGGGAIGGTNNGDIPSLTATYVARTGAGGGTADGAFEDEGALSTSGGNTYTDAAVNAVIAKLKNNIKELATVVAQLAADNVALREANRENAAKINATLTSFKTATIMASS